MDFNPNKPAQTKEYFWATYIPDRRPQFKMYAQRGHALSAFKYRDNGILYTWDKKKEEWTEVYRLENDTKPDNCENCGAPIKVWRKSAVIGTDGYWTYPGERVWVDKKTDHPRLIHVCYDCERRLRR